MCLYIFWWLWLSISFIYLYNFVIVTVILLFPPSSGYYHFFFNHSDYSFYICIYGYMWVCWRLDLRLGLIIRCAYLCVFVMDWLLLLLLLLLFDVGLSSTVEYLSTRFIRSTCRWMNRWWWREKDAKSMACSFFCFFVCKYISENQNQKQIK